MSRIFESLIFHIFSLFKAISNDEANSVVVLVKVGIIFSHESISKNEVLEVVREKLSHYCNNTFSLSTFSHLEYIVTRG